LHHRIPFTPSYAFLLTVPSARQASGRVSNCNTHRYQAICFISSILQSALSTSRMCQLYKPIRLVTMGNMPTWLRRVAYFEIGSCLLIRHITFDLYQIQRLFLLYEGNEPPDSFKIQPASGSRVVPNVLRGAYRDYHFQGVFTFLKHFGLDMAAKGMQLCCY
jgi:hypothetical protein